VPPPAVGSQFMVFLSKGAGAELVRHSSQWHFHPLPAAPNVRVQPSHDGAWRGLIEVTHPVAARGAAVN
jgi:hypothetical protein